MTTALTTLTANLAARLDLGGENSEELLNTLKGTAFKGQVSDAQMAALLIVANQHGLNPWTREIYAFPDKNNGIVPVVGVDGWSRIINSHPQFDGMDFSQDDEKCACRIYRKDRSRPVEITEYSAECKRETPPWKSHPRRMLRHKAMIQCARIAFGYGGIFDEEEARDAASGAVIEGEIVRRESARPAVLPPYPDESVSGNLPKWKALVESGKKTPEDILAMLSTRATLTDAQRETIRESLSAPAPEANAPLPECNPAEFDEKLAGWAEAALSGRRTPAQVADMAAAKYALTNEQRARIMALQTGE